MALENTKNTIFYISGQEHIKPRFYVAELSEKKLWYKRIKIVYIGENEYDQSKETQNF